MKAIYAGSFNLFHAGHYYVYTRACSMFGKDNVYLCVAVNPKKEIDSEFIKWTLNPITPNVIIAKGLVSHECPDVLVRGLRDAIDLSEEMTMADWNEKLGVPTIFIPCTGNLRHISSSALRELINLDVNIDQDENIPNETHLTFKRWKNGRLPDRKLFCGKIGIGKSTYIKNLEEEVPVGSNNFCGDCDKLIWQFFDKDQKKFIKKQLTYIISSGKSLGYHAMLEEMNNEIKWEVLFDGYYNFEVSALGQWINLIPNRILSKFQIVELTLDVTTRMERTKSRGLTIEQVENFDKFYKSPYFVDETIDILNY